MFTTRRKHAYEALHPETRQGGVGRGGYEKDANLAGFSADTTDGIRGSNRAQGNASANLAPAFTADTAAKQNVSAFRRLIRDHAETLNEINHLFSQQMVRVQGRAKKDANFASILACLAAD